MGETIDAGAEAAGMKGVVPTLVRIDATAMMSEKEYEGSSNGDDGDDERDGDGDGMVTMVRTLIGMDAAMTIDEEMEMNRIGSRSRRAERSRRREWIRKMGFKNEHEMPSQMIIHLRTASKDSNEDDEEEKVRKWLRILRHSGYVTVTRGDSSSSATGRCKNCVAVTVMRNAAVRGTADVPVWT